MLSLRKNEWTATDKFINKLQVVFPREGVTSVSTASTTWQGGVGGGRRKRRNKEDVFPRFESLRIPA